MSFPYPRTARDTVNRCRWLTPGLALFSLLMLALAGCGSASHTAAPSPTVTASTALGATGTGLAGSTIGPSATEPSSTAAPSGGSGGTAGDACTLLPAAAAAKASGLDITSAKPEGGTTGATVCSYGTSMATAADDESQPSITVFSASSHVTLADLKTSMDGAASQASPTVAISGVGDQAYAADSGVIAQSGSHLVQIEGLASDVEGNHAPSTAMAKAVIAALG
jgi:hypothetical protein